MAVSAALVSGSFLVLLISLALWDFLKEKKPLLIHELLIFPVIGVVLSFAGRRMIRNSEGTRTGEQLINAAWWGSVVGGLGFGAYLFAIDFAIRREAASEVDKFVNNLIKEDPTDPNHIYLNRAFIATLDPKRRGDLFADDPARLESEFREAYLAFKQCDLVRMIDRNRGHCEYVPTGVKDWLSRPTSVDCLYSGMIKCPEGVFPFQVSMRGEEATSSSQATRRQWLIMVPPTGVFIQDEIKRTPYGWYLEALELTGAEFGKDFIYRMGYGVPVHAETYHLMIGPEAELPLWNKVWLSTPGRWAVGGVSAGILPYLTADCSKYYRDDFFKLPAHFKITDQVLTTLRSSEVPEAAIAKLNELKDKELAQEEFAKEIARVLPEEKESWKNLIFKQSRLAGGGEPSAEQKTQFKKAWETIGLFASGMRLKNNLDKYPLTTITDNGIEVRVPCELPIPGNDGSIARCRLVVGFTDPSLIAELNRLRAEANPDQATTQPSIDIRTVNFKWRVIRLETDMNPISNLSQRQAMPGAPGRGMPTPAATAAPTEVSP
jgi:hypothetical protein